VLPGEVNEIIWRMNELMKIAHKTTGTLFLFASKKISTSNEKEIKQRDICSSLNTVRIEGIRYRITILFGE
jgi:hypothetical protein